MRQLRVHKLPREVTPDELAGSTVVVIDLLRATSTICQALAAGATEVVPYLEIEEALAAAAKDRANVVLGGERHGMRIDGFDLGNSPSEYTPESVAGRRVIITTTNGTRALDHSRQAARVILGSFLNLSAVVASLQEATRVDILCAGTDGQETQEDILAAGGIVHCLCYLPDADFDLSDSATMAGRDWSLVMTKAQLADRSCESQIALTLRETAGGMNLLSIGHDHDLIDCARIDALTVVPELDVAAWRITAG